MCCAECKQVPGFPRRSVCGNSFPCWKVWLNSLSRLIGVVGSLLLEAGLPGCAASGQRSRYVEQIDPGSVTNLIAYRAGTNLQIRVPLRGKDVYAHASWPRPDTEDTNYHHRVAVLT